jgi:small GTP-binding protein
MYMELFDQNWFSYVFSLVVVVVGDSSVGKSQLILRYTTNQFAENTKATIGVSFGHKTVQKGDELIQAQIWDTGSFLSRRRTSFGGTDKM